MSNISYGEKDRDRILEIYKEVGTYKDTARRIIAEGISKTKNLGSAERTVKRIVDAEQKSIVSFSGEVSLDSMSREERYKYLKNNMERFPRTKMFFQSFSDEEKKVFLDEYFKIINSFDSITEPEEQTLFTAILEYILAARAMRLKSLEEDLYRRSMNGEISEGDPEYRRNVSDKFQKEYESHMKNYENLLKASKATRNQRLSEIRSERKTLVDVAEELTNKNIQSDIAERIHKLSTMRDEELKRLIENGYLFGDFND